MRLDDREIGVRLGLAALAGVGPVVALYTSMVSALAPPIPYKLIPDIRPVILFGVTFGVSAFAAFGPGRRRAFLVAFLLALHGVFALELSTIHWFAPYPGPIGGSRADPLRLAAAVSGLGAALLLHARAHSDATRDELTTRGVPAGEASVVGHALRATGVRAVLLAGGAVALLAVLVEGTALVAGNEGALPLPVAILLGAVLLAAAGAAVGLAARRARA